MDISKLHPNSLAVRDYTQQQSVPDITEMYKQASAKSGKPINQMLKEADWGYDYWPGRMTRLDYVTYRLYELSRRERKEFISEWLHWPIHEFTKDDEWSNKTVDKWQCTNILTQAGIPTIPIVAIIDTSEKTYNNTPKINTGDQLRKLLENTDLPLFAKPNNLLGSFGAFRINAISDEYVIVNDGEQIPFDRMIEEFMASIPYVLQPVMENHPIVQKFANGLATLRTVNLVKNDEVNLECGVFKIPVGNNLADNFWRDGNLASDINLATGMITRVIQGTGPSMVKLSDHPNTNTRLIGVELPFWSEILDLNKRTAQLFSSINYQSLDIAITNDGPIIVEVNSGSSFTLPQLASGRGFLTTKNKKFFESCGVDFGKLPLPD